MRFSVIIPTHNRPQLLDRCLQALRALRYPRNLFEVLVVDDASHPPASLVTARHAEFLNLTCSRFDTSHGPAKARNKALREARGEYVIFTDDDCEPHPDWLSAFDAAFTRHPEAALGGRILDSPQNGICGITSQMLVTYLYDYAQATGRLRFFCSNNLAFPRQALLDLTGGFEEAFPLAAAEDRDICARWLLHREMFYAPEAVIWHRQDLTFTRFLAQHYRYGRGAFQFWSRRRNQGEAGNRLETWRFYTRLLAFPFSETATPSKTAAPRALVMSALLALSQVACAAGYFRERRRALTQET